jgi:hypothetical protein
MYKTGRGQPRPSFLHKLPPKTFRTKKSEEKEPQKKETPETQFFEENP